MSENHVIDDAFTELKGKGMATTDDVKNLRDSIYSDEDSQKNAQEFLDHLENCNDDSCKIHKSKINLQNKSWYRGFITGVAYGKKRN